MKILLLKDVYHLGHAGDVKKVADGYGRNYLIPQGFAVMATAGALKQAESIRAKAEVIRKQQNTEMSAVSDRINGTWITFASKAGETGKLYGSITSQMVAEKIGAQLAPVGTVWAKIRAEHPDIDLFWKDGEHAGLFAKQLYDLAALANAPLKPEAMTEFINRSNEIMMLLAKE